MQRQRFDSDFSLDFLSTVTVLRTTILLWDGATVHWSTAASDIILTISKRRVVTLWLIAELTTKTIDFDNWGFIPQIWYLFWTK